MKLTSKEVRIIALLCKELSIHEISLIMELQPATIKKYVRNIQKKIGAKNEVGIALYALFNGLIQIQMVTAPENSYAIESGDSK